MERAIKHKRKRNSKWKEMKSQDKNQELSGMSGNKWRPIKPRLYLLDFKWVEYFNSVRTLFFFFLGLCPESRSVLKALV